MSRGEKNDDGIRRPHVETSDDPADVPSADQFTEEHASHIPWAEDRPIVREDEKYTGAHTPVAPAHRRSTSQQRNTLNEGDRTMARSVTGLFTEQTQVDRIVGALIDAGFDAEHISAVSPDDQAAGTTTPVSRSTPGGRGLGAWLVDHLRRRGLSHEHALRYQDHVAQGRRLVSVTVTTDAEDEEARSLMVDIGADEISSAADGTMRVVHRAPPPGAVPPNA
jgi:hypothetical protein